MLAVYLFKNQAYLILLIRVAQTSMPIFRIFSTNKKLYCRIRRAISSFLVYVSRFSFLESFELASGNKTPSNL